MDWTSAPITEDAPLEPAHRRFLPAFLAKSTSRNRIAWERLVRACADADIVVADRRLPRGCTPRWLKLDRPMLAETGGIALFLDGKPRLATVAEQIGDHPWRQAYPSRSFGSQAATSLPPGSMK